MWDIDDMFEEFEARNEVADADTGSGKGAGRVKGTKKQPELNLFRDIIPAMNKRDGGYYARQSDRGKQDIRNSFWMLQRITSAPPADSEFWTPFINQVVNEDWSAVTGHPELRWRLFCICGQGGYVKYAGAGVGTPIVSRSETAIGELLLEFNPGMKDYEIGMVMDRFSLDELKQMFKNEGVGEERLKEVFPPEKKSKSTTTNKKSKSTKK